MHASIQARGTQTAVQFDGSDSIKGACELRYSGGSSYIPENNSKTNSGEIYTPLGSLHNFYIYSALLEPFAPLNKRKAYRQVLVQCPQAEWRNNRNVHFFFLANDTLIEVLQPQSRGQTDINEVPDLKRVALVKSDVLLSVASLRVCETVLTRSTSRHRVSHWCQLYLMFQSFKH